MEFKFDLDKGFFEPTATPWESVKCNFGLSREKLPIYIVVYVISVLLYTPLVVIFD